MKPQRGLLFVGIFLLFLPREAQAYVDPGMGSFLMQTAAGGTVALLMILKLFWMRLRAWFKWK